MEEARADTELMRLYLEGDEAAFHELYRRYSKRVYGYLRARLPMDERAADDLFQTVFLKLHRSRESFRREYRFDAWLFTLCHNVLVDYFRERSRRADQPGDETDHVRLLELAASPMSADGEKSGIAELLARGGVTGQAESAIRYRYADELSFEEIASALGTTSANARQLVSRAVRRIRRALK